MKLKKIARAFNKANYFVFTFFIALVFLWGVLAPIFVPNRILNIGGSTSVSPIFGQEINNAFRKYIDGKGQSTKKPNEVEYFSVGSSGGLKNVIFGSYDVGFMSKDLDFQGDDRYADQRTKITNSGDELKIFSLATDAIIFIYNLPSGCKSPTTNINLNQNNLKKIFQKKIAYWEDVTDVTCTQRQTNRIVRINREHGSGTRSVFEKKILEKTEDSRYYDDQTEPKSEQTLRDVGSTQGALAYVSFAYKSRVNNDHKIKWAKYENTEPTASTVADNSYKFSRPFIGLYLQKNKKKLKQFFDFLKSQKASTIIGELGFTHSYSADYTYPTD